LIASRSVPFRRILSVLLVVAAGLLGSYVYLPSLFDSLLTVTLVLLLILAWVLALELRPEAKP
jgi:hypothetical protein